MRRQTDRQGVTNHERPYSIGPADRENPPADKSEHFAWLEGVWTDAHPPSLRTTSIQAAEGKRPQAVARPCSIPQEETTVAAPDWPHPPPDFALADDEVHVWCASLDKPATQLAQFSSMLCPDERQRTDRFRFDRHRQWFIVRRGLLRMLLGRYLNVEPDRLVFDRDSRGKPSISEPHNGRTLHFNVSDSSGLVLYALTRRAPLGVDVERIKPVRDMDGIVARFFSAPEKAAIGALSEPQKSAVFFSCWTRTEAYLKATGEGISEWLPRVEVPGDGRVAAEWAFHSFEPAAGFVGALAIKATGLRLSCWRWPES